MPKIKRAHIDRVFTRGSFFQAPRSPSRFALVYCKQRSATLNHLHLLSFKLSTLQTNKNGNKIISKFPSKVPAVTRLRSLPTSNEYVNDMPTSPLMILSLLITANIPAKNIRQFPRNSRRTASHLWKAIENVFATFVLHFPEYGSYHCKASSILPHKNLKQRFHSDNASNVFCPHYAGGIWKRNNHRPFCICICVKLEQGNHMIIGTSKFTTSFVFKMFSVHNKTLSRGFQIPPVWRAFSKSSVFVTD